MIQVFLSLLQPYEGAFSWLEATQALATGEGEKALPFLARAAELESNLPEPHNQVGNAYLALERWEEARDAFARALEADSENATAHLGMAIASSGLEDWDVVIDNALSATELFYFNPRAHFVLGNALAAKQDDELARTAYEVALKQAPGFSEAHEALAGLLQDRFGEEEAATNHRKAAELSREAAGQQRNAGELDPDQLQASIDKRRMNRPHPKSNGEDWSSVPPSEIITVVSGLPRSGTSMMMQMLDRGGMTPFTDGKRVPDPDNPKGYYEHEKATQLGRDQSWIPDVRGKCVKIVAQLLPMLPRNGEKYRIVFMDRDLREIARSQASMLERLGRSGGDLSETKLMSTLDSHVGGIEKWMSIHPNLQCIFVDYADVLKDPAGVASRLNAFFGGILDEQAMCTAVDPSLQRQRT